jgi:hypothetical protein
MVRLKAANGAQGPRFDVRVNRRQVKIRGVSGHMVPHSQTHAARSAAALVSRSIKALLLLPAAYGEDLNV